MFGISTNGGGECIGFPDVCKTPAAPSPLPIPYPNIAKLTDADGGTCSSKVKIGGKKVVTAKTKIRRSSGDEAGTLGGVVSGVNMGPGSFKSYSSHVKAEGEGVVYVTCPTGQNGNNANLPGAQVSPSQTDVTVNG